MPNLLDRRRGRGLVLLGPLVTQEHFADRYIHSARRLKNPLCVGLDPYLDKIPVEFGVKPDEPASDASADGVLGFLTEVLDQCSGRVPAVKPQIAFFEQMGWRGMRCLEQVVAHAKKRELLVILDAKRGDIGSTAQAYAQSYLWPNSALRADAITINPYLGMDSLEPFFDASWRYGVGVFVLARTSNPGAKDFQSAKVSGVPLFERVAEALADQAAQLRGKSGWSNLGVVAGATYPDEALRLRHLLPYSLFLVPGYGAQGGALSQALAGFVPGKDQLEGGTINSSRGILYGADSAGDWRAGVAERIAAARSELEAAISLP
jgi:orotidine-5'-phosphate decarboxylase